VEGFTIGRLAREAGVNVETVRYYERRALLRQPPRTPGGYRQYSQDDVRRLQYIGRAKRLGFTLSEIATLADSTEGVSAEEVLRVAQSRMRLLDQRQRELSETRARLQQLLTLCQGAHHEDCVGLRVAT
jgi:MerR family transcriptional regulator, mercuric resistance operon regulatory protein